MSSLPYRSQRRGSPARALASGLTRAMPRTDRGAFSRRRRLVTALLVPLCLVASAACAPGQSPSGSEEAATLRVSTWGNDSRLKLTQQAVAAFTAANPGVKVSCREQRLERLLGQARHDDGGQQRT